MLAVGVDRGFPSAGTFLWRRLNLGEKFSLRASTRGDDRPEVGRDARHLRHNNCQRPLPPGRATPPHRQNQLDVAYFTSDPHVRNGTLYGRHPLVSSASADPCSQNNHFNNCQTPYPAAPTMAARTTLSNTMTSLNFRYLCLSGGDRELCGKYGGGVYVAMLIQRSRRRQHSAGLLQLLFLLFLQ